MYKENYVKPLIWLFISLLVITVCFYVVRICYINKAYHQIYDTKDEIGLRKFPYPYKAALTIANDIDKTTNAEEFLKIHEFLNTKNITEMGEGVGLEISDSFFMFRPTLQDEFCYYSIRPIDKIIIRKFMQAGFIDSIHSWGRGYEGRDDAIIALNELNKYNLKSKVWINHDYNKSNLGNWFPRICLGDNKNTKYYHADLTLRYGIRYVWNYSSTCVVGQASPITISTFTGIYDPDYPLKSIKNMIKALFKHFLSIFGLCKRKYSLHASNDLVKILALDDGQKIYEFMRYDAHPDGIGIGATSKKMAYNLSKRVIEQLKKVHGYAIMYTHFGKNKGCPQVICEETQRALRYLEKQYQSGEVYVTTTSKILNYYINHKYLRWSSTTHNNEVTIEIHSVEDPVFGSFIPSAEELQGITFYVPSGKKVKILIDGQELKDILKNPADETSRESVTIPLTFLDYPDLEPLGYLIQ